ncbi:MAG: general stress protein [Burkholderiaceae bacterium]
MAQHNKPGATGTSRRGFASMDPALQREIASKGGRSVPPEERSFSKDRALAAQAGRKGGEASHGTRRTTTAAAGSAGSATASPGGDKAAPGAGGGSAQPGEERGSTGAGSAQK